MRGCQHQQSTHTADLAVAMAFKLRLPAGEERPSAGAKAAVEDRSRLPRRLVCYEMRLYFALLSAMPVASITAINRYSGSGFQHRLDASLCRRLGKAIGNKNNIIRLQLQISAFRCKN